VSTTHNSSSKGKRRRIANGPGREIKKRSRKLAKRNGKTSRLWIGVQKHAARKAESENALI